MLLASHRALAPKRPNGGPANTMTARSSCLRQLGPRRCPNGFWSSAGGNELQDKTRRYVIQAESFTCGATPIGTVTDSSGAVIPGASVEVLNTATNYPLAREPKASGLDASPPLPPGPYRIAISSEGFRTVAKEVSLNLPERIAVDFELETCAVAELAAVEAVRAVLKTQTAKLSTLRAEQEVKECRTSPETSWT